MSLLESCTTSLTYTKRNKHHVDLLKAAVDNRTAGAVSKVRAGGGVAEAYDYEFSERAHWNNSSSKSSASQAKRGLQRELLLSDFHRAPKPLRLRKMGTSTTHFQRKKEEKSQTLGFIADYLFHFLQKYCTKIWIYSDRERLTIAAEKPISTWATYRIY